MKLYRVAATAMLVLVCFFLSACNSPRVDSVDLTGQWNPPSPMYPGGGYSFTVTVHISFRNNKTNSLPSESIGLPYAEQVEFDTTGSTIKYPSSGNGVLYLKDPSTGAVQAAGRFDWVLNGSSIRFQDPNAINNWMAQAVDRTQLSSYEISYEASPFGANSGPGAQTMALELKFAGQTVANFRKTLLAN